MTDTALSCPAARRSATEASVESAAAARGVFAGVFVMSLSSLLLELALTRLFSVVLFYHFAFLAISIALLGLGAGGVFAYLRQAWLARWKTRSLGMTVAALNALAVLLALEVVLHTPVALQLTRSSFLRLAAIYLAAAVPFCGTGLIFSVVFAREKRRVAPLYGADLVGAACACLAIVPLLDFLGGPNAVICAALGMAVASLCWAETRNRRWVAAMLAAALALLIAANHSGKLVDVIYAKGLARSGEWIEFARWNAISRIEVDRLNSVAKAIVIDADAMTYIMNQDPRSFPGSPEQRRMMTEVPSVANVLRPRGDYAIIGPGGGVDVLRALGTGSPSVTAIEINPLIADTVMRGKYAGYSHHLYDQPQVHLHVGDGRSWVRGSRQRFDVVQMTLVDTWASTAAGAFALSENNLYTVEAFREYFEHLKPDGLLAITRWEFQRPREALRVVAVAMAALQRLGIRNPAQHFIVVSQGELVEDGLPVLVLAKKSPFTIAEEATVLQHLLETGTLKALYLPSVPGNNAFSALIASNDPYGFSHAYDFNVAPVSDNAPFFFFTLKLNQVFNQGLQRGIDWKVNVGVAVLLMVLVISVVAVALFLLLPLWLGHTRVRQSNPLFYFIAVGLGYILVEIAFIQRFVLFLGHPTYALTVVVFLMLLASGLGSLASRRLLQAVGQIRLALLIIVAALLGYLYVLPHILTGLVGEPFLLKLALSALLLVPLGFVMGMPFPTGLRALHGAQENTVEWAWAMNAASSVLGSVLAMVLAIQFGLTVVLACGAAAYGLALGLTAAFPSPSA